MNVKVAVSRLHFIIIKYINATKIVLLKNSDLDITVLQEKIFLLSKCVFLSLC